MTPEQAKALADVANRERERITAVVDAAFADQSDPRLVKPLIVEFVLMQALVVHQLVGINAALDKISAEMVKANEPVGIMSSSK